jgi:hypothetical protein
MSENVPGLLTSDFGFPAFCGDLASLPSFGIDFGLVSAILAFILKLISS